MKHVIRLAKRIMVPLKFIIRLAKRIKVRFYFAAIIIIASIAVTPWAVEEAYRFRGYEAIGGEVLIIPMGIIIACLVCGILKDYDIHVERRKNLESANDQC